MILPSEVCAIIADFAVRKRYRPRKFTEKLLKEWKIRPVTNIHLVEYIIDHSDIGFNKLRFFTEVVKEYTSLQNFTPGTRPYDKKSSIDWSNICLDREAVRIVKNFPEMICWLSLSVNVHAREFLLKNSEKLQWGNCVSLYVSHDDMKDLVKLQTIFPEKINDWEIFAALCDDINILEIYIDKLRPECLSRNENAIPLLEKYPDKISPRQLSRNENAVPLLEKNPQFICWHNICFNKNARDLIKKNPEKILNWEAISERADMIDLIEENMNLVNVPSLCKNPAAKHIIEQLIGTSPELSYYYDVNDVDIQHFHKNHIVWDFITENPGMVDIFEIYPEKATWSILSMKTYAIHIIEKNLHLVDWNSISGNPAAMHILKDNLDKVNWEMLSELSEAFDILTKHIHKVDWDSILSSNSRAADLLDYYYNIYGNIPIDIQKYYNIDYHEEYPELRKKIIEKYISIMQYIR